MVTDTAGLGDQNFNDLANRGGKKAAQDFGIDWHVLESQDATAYVPNLTSAAEQGELSIGVGFYLTDAITSVAQQFPDDKFLLIDSSSDAPNVESVTFKEQEGAFLAGIVSGLFTKTNKLGFVGGQKIPPVIHYQVGFQAGVKSVNPQATVAISYVDSFDDIQLGKEYALAQFNQGADIVFPAAGRTGIGCYEAVKEKGKPGGEFWVIGADVDQDHLAPGYQLCVSSKGVDVAVFDTIKSVVDGNFEPGPKTLGLKENGVGLETPNNRVPADIMAVVEQYKQAIIAGQFTVPTTEDELKAFQPPAVGTPVASPAASPTA
ncbi:MAG TPA: BMP family ABC transporter substrate-binding protein [Thermomicrobiales bacterium]|nr:BMP family ABC transporter substrate-binding protein [Thermomicrobiales bacterium]